jgi:hypothetical protein
LQWLLPSRGAASNDEKTMRAVAPELFGEAIFPVETGLHERHEIIVAIGPPNGIVGCYRGIDLTGTTPLHGGRQTQEKSMVGVAQGFGRKALILGALFMMTVGAAYAEPTPVRVRGTVVSLDGSKLVVHPKTGDDITVMLNDNFAAIAVVKASMTDIKEGTFIGTATVTQPDSSLKSLEVVVFPDKMRGTGEGHYPWDLGPKSMMTNATVSNAVKGVDGQSITVSYKGGEKKIDVPADVPVVTLVPGADKADIKPGAIVFVPTQKQDDGSLHGGAVLFGKDGLTPPM